MVLTFCAFEALEQSRCHCLGKSHSGRSLPLLRASYSGLFKWKMICCFWSSKNYPMILNRLALLVRRSWIRWIQKSFVRHYLPVKRVQCYSCLEILISSWGMPHAKPLTTSCSTYICLQLFKSPQNWKDLPKVWRLFLPSLVCFLPQMKRMKDQGWTPFKPRAFLMSFIQFLPSFIMPYVRVCAFYSLIQLKRMTGSPIPCFNQASYVFGLC